MAQGEGFKHITVTPPEEEDEVIFAGASSQADASTQVQGVDGNASDNALTQSAPPEADGTRAPDDEPPLSTPLETVPSGTDGATTPDDEPPQSPSLATAPSGTGGMTTPDGKPPLSTPLATAPSGTGGMTTPDGELLQSIPSVGAHSVRPASEASAGDLAAKGALRPVKPSKDPYRDPTLEDLHGAPMPLTQKIVIAAALVCIIGAVIYYLAFMG